MKDSQKIQYKKGDKMIIIDGNALIHRSFHALPPTMTTRSGEMTNAVYGFAMVLFKAISEFKPSFVVLTLDRKEATFRHQKYGEYKAHREKAPDDLYRQIPLVKKLTESLNIPIFEMAGFEADDLIGTIAKKTDGDIEKIIVTGDLDALQLVNKHTRVYTMSRGLSDSVIYDEEKVKERYNLYPNQMIDYKALRGDPSDNIPGVKGIGEKTATDLLREFNNLENIYNSVENNREEVEKVVKPRIVDLLIDHKSDAYLSKELATIKCDVKIDFDISKAVFGNFDKEKIVEILSDLEFKSLIPKIKDLEKGAKGNVFSNKEELNKFERNKKDFKYVLVDTEKKFEKFLIELLKQKEFTFDTETTSFDPITAELLGISFSWKEGEANYILIKRETGKVKNKPDNINLFNYKNSDEKAIGVDNAWLKKLKPIFENKKVGKFAHNMKYDYRVMKNAGINVCGIKMDTMIASYLLNPGSRQHNLDTVTFTELGFEKISKEDLLGKGRDKITFGEVETEKLCLYSCEDADFTHRLTKKLKKELKEHLLEELFKKIEIPLIEVLAEMEENGIKINENFLKKLSQQINEKINKLENNIWKKAGVKFNINSTKQLKEILFDKLDISTNGIKKGKTGFSTSADELEKIKNHHPIIELLQEYRELKKLTTTYIDALPLLINKKTKRLHSSFNQTVTATGRLSSTEPNLQNIPVRTKIGREIRKAFIADKGHKLVAFDYSQIELRLAAHLSGDKKMIKAFKDGADIHTSTAAEINLVKTEEVSSKMRREAKAINFGILYGQGSHGLSQTADISYARAKEFIDKYFESYSGVKKYIEKQIKKAGHDGYVETLFGRRRYLPEINSSVVMIKKAAERMAVNTPLQGSAADMIKVAMIKIYEILSHSISQNSDEVRMLLQVHDELVFEIRNEKVDEYVEKIKGIMENVVKLKIPIIVDVKAGESWGKMEKLNI